MIPLPVGRAAKASRFRGFCGSPVKSLNSGSGSRESASISPAFVCVIHSNASNLRVVPLEERRHSRACPSFKTGTNHGKSRHNVHSEPRTSMVVVEGRSRRDSMTGMSLYFSGPSYGSCSATCTREDQKSHKRPVAVSSPFGMFSWNIVLVLMQCSRAILEYRVELL